MAILTGTSGNDTLNGTAGDDAFRLYQGGDDTANGDAGNDIFYMRATLNAADRIDGGADSDKVSLDGDYSTGLIFDAETIKNIESLSFVAGHDYNLTTHDGNVAAAQTLSLFAGSLGAGNSLTFDGSAELDGIFRIYAGAGNDTLTGGAQNDAFHLETGGDDTANGGGGNDVFYLGGTLDALDSIDGGSGSDTVTLAGLGINDAITLGASTLAGIESLILKDGVYAITTNDGNVAAGEKLTVNGTQVTGGWTFDGSAETDGFFDMRGSAGGDFLTGGSSNDSFTLTLGGNDTVHGGGGGDTVALGSMFTAADSIDGGTGSDQLNLSGNYSAGVILSATTLTSVEAVYVAPGFDYTLTTDDATVATGQSFTVKATALGAGDMLTFDGSAETDGTFDVRGGAAGDSLTGGGMADTFNLVKGGDDTVDGGGGNDKFILGATFTVADSIDGGTGSDQLYLGGDYSAGVILSAATLVGVEAIYVAPGFDYVLTTDDATVATGQTFTVKGSALGSGDTLTFDGSAETDGTFDLRGGAGGDVLDGGQNGDTFDLSSGGNDSVSGHGGNDTFNMGAAFDTGDNISGGAGSDTAVLDGGYSGGLSITSADLNLVETLMFAAGNAYTIEIDDTVVGGTDTLTADASGLGATHTLTFNGSAETGNSLILLGGMGDDVLTSGGGTDTFDLTHGGDDASNGGGAGDTFNLGTAFTTGDQVNGGTGTDTLNLDGDYTSGVIFGATTLTAVETIVLTAGHGYSLTTHDATVAATATLTINGSALGAGEVLTFNGAAETDGGFAITGGAGNDTLTGGAVADTFDLSHGSDDTANGGGAGDNFNLGAAFTASDAIDGSTGTDTLNLDGDYTSGVIFVATTLTSVETIVLAAGHGYSLTTHDNTVAAAATLTVNGSALGAAEVLTFNGAAETDGAFALTGGAGNDNLTGGAQADTFDLSMGGADASYGGGGSDTFNLTAAFTASDTFDGGTGTDTLNLDGDYTSGVTFGATTLTSAETIVLAAGHGYSLTTHDATVAAAATLTVNGSALGATEILTFNGAAETNGAFAITGGAGNDTLAGGTGNDSFTGGGGSDTVDYTGSSVAITVDLSAGTATGAGTDSLSSIENVTGSGQADRVTVSSVANVILAGVGDDIILVANAADASGDTLDGGTGTNDRIRFTSTTAGETLTLNSGTTGVETAVVSDASGVTTGTTALNVDASAVVGTIALTGNDGDNVLIGNGSANTIIGGGGADAINAGAGSDTVNAGNNNDTVIGNADGVSDTYNGGSGTDRIDYSALTSGQNISVNLATGAASGTAIGSDNLSGSSFENLDAGGGNDSLFGSAANNMIQGNAGTDNIVGGGGSDALYGGAGNDTLNGGVNDFSVTPASANDALYGGADTDTFRFEGRFGDDNIGDSGTADWADGEDILLVGYAAFTPLIIDVTGGALITIDDGSVASSVMVWGATAAQLDVAVSGSDLLID